MHKRLTSGLRGIFVILSTPHTDSGAFDYSDVEVAEIEHDLRELEPDLPAVPRRRG